MPKLVIGNAALSFVLNAASFLVTNNVKAKVEKDGWRETSG
jgi:hypothetical protein